MEAIRSNKVAAVLVTDGTRLARNYQLFGKLVQEMNDNGVRVILGMEKQQYLPEHIHDDSNGLDYTLHGDYYFPILFDPEQENLEPIGKWGIMRKKYLEDDRPGLFSRLLLSGKLMDHLRDIDTQANERFDTLMDGYKRAWNITEALKAEDPMHWVGLMNNARDAAEWNIITEIIFS